jgi:hypothetical protein
MIENKNYHKKNEFNFCEKILLLCTTVVALAIPLNFTTCSANCKPALPVHAVQQVLFSGGITFNKWARPGIQAKTKERGGGDFKIVY